MSRIPDRIPDQWPPDPELAEIHATTMTMADHIERSLYYACVVPFAAALGLLAASPVLGLAVRVGRWAAGL